MNGEILGASLVAAQQHNMGAGGVVMLAAIAAIALVAFGIAWWQRKRARAEQQSNSHDRPAQNTRSPEEK
jgi:Flp pilus assembly protein TadB